MFTFDPALEVDAATVAAEMMEAVEAAANEIGIDPAAMAEKFLATMRATVEQFARIARQGGASC